MARPQACLRGAAKHRHPSLHPERGLRVEVAERRGVSSVDPKILYNRQGRLCLSLPEGGQLPSLDLVEVDPWVTATMLQGVTARRACWRFGPGSIISLRTRACGPSTLDCPRVRRATIRGEQERMWSRSFCGRQRHDPTCGRYVYAVASSDPTLWTSATTFPPRKARRMPPVCAGQKPSFQPGLPDAHCFALSCLAGWGTFATGDSRYHLPDSLRPIEWHSIPENLRRGGLRRRKPGLPGAPGRLRSASRYHWAPGGPDLARPHPFGRSFLHLLRSRLPAHGRQCSSGGGRQGTSCCCSSRKRKVLVRLCQRSGRGRPKRGSQTLLSPRRICFARRSHGGPLPLTSSSPPKILMK